MRNVRALPVARVGSGGDEQIADCRHNSNFVVLQVPSVTWGMKLSELSQCAT